jgi:hypothetical protein
MKPVLPAPLPFLALGAFLVAGDLKGGAVLSRSPVDLTLLAGTVLALVLARSWMRGARLASLPGAALEGVWYLTFLPGVLGAASTGYALQKVATIYTFSLLATLAPLVLVQRDADLEGLLDAMALAALLLVLDGFLAAGSEARRLASAGGGTIALGRAAGFLLLYGALRWDGRAFWAGTGVAALGAVALLFSGSRGPMGGAALALAAPLLAARNWSLRARARAFLRLGAVLLALLLSLSLAPPDSIQRTVAFLRGDYGPSEQYRVLAARAAWEGLAEAPLGAGWGGFAREADLDSGSARQYPHNLLLEVTFEAGWICGLATLLVGAAALACAWGRSRLPRGRLLLAGLLFCGFNALVSGDVNDNRPLFALLSAALGRWGHPEDA